MVCILTEIRIWILSKLFNGGHRLKMNCNEITQIKCGQKASVQISCKIKTKIRANV